MAQPLTDAINALTTYANTVTGASDTTLSDAVATLASGYGGGVTKTLTNILGNTATLEAGFLNNTGVMQTQQATAKEMTTDYIDIEQYAGQDVYYFLKCGGNVAPWIGIVFYDSNKARLGNRIIPLEVNSSGNSFNSKNDGFEHYGNGNGTLAVSQANTISSTAKYIRISFRTGGNGLLCVVPPSEINLSDYFETREISTLAFVNAIESNGTV